jgi:hypothetical protein
VTLSPQLLAQLRAAGLGVSQHHYVPRPDEWFAGSVSGEGRIHGEVGPFPSAEAALIGGVRWIVRLLDENTDRAERAEGEVQSLSVALHAAQAELRAEREAQGR